VNLIGCRNGVEEETCCKMSDPQSEFLQQAPNLKVMIRLAYLLTITLLFAVQVSAQVKQ